MATIPAFGARTLPATTYPASTNASTSSSTNASSRAEGKTANVPATQKAAEASSLSRLSSSALDMQQRVSKLGNATVDFAQDFVSSFTHALFGDDAKGATIDFDSASLEASSSYALGVQQTSGANGVRTLAGLSMTDSSHFIGKGTITTADGRKFDFEVEVKYEAKLDVAAGSQTAKAATDKADAKSPGASLADLPTVKVPNIDFPGTLADLFQLIGRDLQSALAANGDPSGQSDQSSDNIDRNTLRGLSLRLLNLVDSKNADTYNAPVNASDKAPSAAEQAKSAAAYGEQAPVDDLSTPIKAAPDGKPSAPPLAVANIPVAATDGTPAATSTTAANQETSAR